MSKIDLYKGECLKREDGVTYIATVSGGKDSVTMCDLLLKNGYPVDFIIFTDTLEEFDEMYEYIEKLKDYFQERYNKEIVVLKPKSTFDDWCNGVIEKKSAKRKGMVRGIPTKDGMCYWRRESKIYPVERFIKKIKIQNELEKSINLSKNKTIHKDFKVIQYIGYTMGEDRSVQDTDITTFKYPLKDIFKMTEEDCKAYISKQDMENPLYKHFSRTGCAMCPFQSDKSWFMVWKHYPKIWDKMLKREMKLDYIHHNKNKVINKYWFINHKTILEKEKEFQKMEKQGSLFDFSDEPVKDCFCKI